ncbi:hypothetical protein X777_16809 [Ooceraea biroi]|uniref:Uncharacterized protein n=1 Tax=Ooceraea biroi TaxID=2015173 RepID=A0A026WWZ7_OOCBI|nr:hypothetical protein X777_16809 [Ooceraea biroi]
MKRTNYVRRVSVSPRRLPSLFGLCTQFCRILYEMVIILDWFFLLNLDVILGASIILIVRTKDLEI